MATPQTQYFNFGSGFIFAIPVSGQLAANPTPILLGTIQDASLDITFKNEKLMGNLQFPDDVARGDGECKGTITIGRLNTALFNQVLFGAGAEVSDGIDIIDVKESHTLTGSPFPDTVTVTHAADFDFDLGVQYAASGSPLTLIPSGTPAEGEYKVDPATGVYTFSNTDGTNSVELLISYAYVDSTSGTTTVVSNQPQGQGPVIQLVLDQPYKGNNSVILHSVRFSSLKMPLKRSGYTLPAIDYDAFCDSSEKLLTWFQGISG